MPEEWCPRLLTCRTIPSQAFSAKLQYSATNTDGIRYTVSQQQISKDGQRRKPKVVLNFKSRTYIHTIHERQSTAEVEEDFYAVEKLVEHGDWPTWKYSAAPWYLYEPQNDTNKLAAHISQYVWEP